MNNRGEFIIRNEPDDLNEETKRLQADIDRANATRQREDRHQKSLAMAEAQARMERARLEHEKAEIERRSRPAMLIIGDLTIKTTRGVIEDALYHIGDEEIAIFADKTKYLEEYLEKILKPLADAGLITVAKELC